MVNFRRRRRRRFRKNGMRKVKKDIKWLKKNIEFKNLDVTATDVDMDTTGTSTRLNLITQSDGVNGRTGNAITARRVMIRGFVHNDRGTPVDCVVRIIVCRQINTAAVALPVANVLISANVNAPRALPTSRNIKVYADETFAMDTLGHSLIPFKFLFKLNNEVRYNTTGGAEAQLEHNGLNIIGISTVANGTANPAMDFISRFSFCDS